MSIILGRRRLALVGALLGGLVAGTASATVIDQSNYGPTNSGYANVNKGSNSAIGQSFTAGLSGLLTSVNLAVYDEGLYDQNNNFSFYNSPLQVSILDSNLHVLGTTTINSIPQSKTPGNALDVTASFLNQGIQLSAGKTYYIAATPTVVAPANDGGNGLSWQATAATYAGGNPVSIANGVAAPFFANTNDLEFQDLVASVNSVTMAGGSASSNPVSVGQKVTVGAGPGGVVNTITYYFGASFGLSDYYAFEDLCSICNETSTITITGANPDQTFTYELFNTDDNFFESVILDAQDNFMGTLRFSAAVSEYTLGIFDNNPNDAHDPTFTVAFSSPVGGIDASAVTLTPAPEPASLFLIAGGLVAVGTMRSRRKRRLDAA